MKYEKVDLNDVNAESRIPEALGRVRSPTRRL